MANLQDSIKLTEILLKDYNLKDWTVTTNNRKRAFGVCNYSKKTIELSKLLVPICSTSAIWNTITHEVAHALAGHMAGHGPKWQHIHKSLGGNGERLSSLENAVGGKEAKENFISTNYKYVGTCPNGHVSHRNRKPTRKCSCGVCSNRFDNRYIITYKLNN